jgi:uncharacterized membrane-anchored protein
LVGTARVDARTKKLAGRLRSGDIAVIDHEDLDRLAAEGLVSAAPAAVLNAARSSTERFPNTGPEVLLRAGIVLVDALGPDIMRVKEGTALRVDPSTGEVFDQESGRLLAAGPVPTVQEVAEAMARAREGMSAEITAFAENTMRFIREEGAEFTDRLDVRDIRTPMRGRHVLIVVRGYRYKEDLAVLKAYVAEYRPVTIGVDGGADALLEAGLRPDVIVGDMDSVSDRALRCGAELVVHAYRDGRAPGAARLERLGVPFIAFPAPGTSEDAAMMIADDKDAELIVAVGTHMTMVEFLDKGRDGMASTFLTRLRVGGKLVDAKGVSRLYRQTISNAQISLLAAAGLLALVAALSATSGGRTVLALAGAYLDDVFAWFGGLWA